MVAALAGATMAFVGPAIRPEPKVNQNHVALRASAPGSPENTESQSPLRVGGAMLSIVAALALVLAPVEAQAAKSGGRIGGTASAARSKPPPRAPVASSSKTTVINKTTVIAPPPVVAPPVVAPPMGMGMGVGFAPAPVVVAPAPSLGDVVVGTVIGGAINNAISGGHHSGPSTSDRLLENQQRQDERQIDNQKAEIDQLKAEIQNMKATKWKFGTNLWPTSGRDGGTLCWLMFSRRWPKILLIDWPKLVQIFRSFECFDPWMIMYPT